MSTVKREGVSLASAVPEVNPKVNVVETNKSELLLFSPISEQTGIIRSEYGAFYPISPLTNQGPITMEVPRNLNSFTDLLQSYWKIGVKVEREDGTDAEGSDEISCVNSIMTSLFSKVSVFVNGVRVSSDHSLFPYTAFIMQLLSYSNTAKETLLKELTGWEKDSGKPDSNNFGENLALAARRGVLLRGKFIGKLPLDLCLQQRLIPNNVDLRIVLERSRDDFCLVKGTGETKRFKIKITDCVFYVRRVTLDETVFKEIQGELAHRPAQYPLLKMNGNALNVPQGTTKFRVRNLFPSEFKPRRLVFGIVPETDFVGKDTTNPFCFANQKLKSVIFYDDVSQLTLEPMRMNFGDNGEWLEPYFALLRTMKRTESGNSLDVTYQQFKNQCCLISADFDPDVHSPSTRGSVSIELEFASATTEVLTVVAVAEFAACMVLNSNREVTYLEY